MIELIGRIKATRSTLKQINDMEQRIRDISRDIEEYPALVQQLADICDLSLDVKDHQKVKSIVDKLVREFDRADKLVNQRDDVEHQIKQHSLAYDKVSAEEKEMAENLASTQSKWHDWLLEHNIHDDFTPKTMQDFISRADVAVTSLDETRRMRTRIVDIENAINEFRDKV